jgi:hypothetical protein
MLRERASCVERGCLRLDEMRWIERCRDSSHMRASADK